MSTQICYSKKDFQVFKRLPRMCAGWKKNKFFEGFMAQKQQHQKD